MKTIRVLFVTLILALVVGVWAQAPRSFRVNFSKTNVDEVMQALSLQTGASIVYNGKGDIPVTVNFLATSAEEAVRGASAAAGLTYRKVGNIFVVAAPENLRKAMLPYGNRVKFAVINFTPEEAAKLVEAAFPTVSAEAAGDRLAVTAIPTEIVMVREFLEDREELALKNKAVRQIVPVRMASPTIVGTSIRNLFPAVTVEAVGKPDTAGGSLIISGPKAEVEAAAKMVEAIDNGAPGAGDDLSVEIYDIRYSSAPELQKVLKETSPEVTVTLGPASYSPRNPILRTLTSARVGGGGVGGSSGGGGDTSGNQSGQSNQANSPDQMPKDGDRAKTLILQGRKSAVASALKLLHSLDIKPKQVLVEVQVIDASPEYAEKLGVKWNWSPFNIWEGRPGSLINDNFKGTTRPMGFGQFSRLPWNINAILDAMVTSKEAKILAKPQVMVIDGDDSNVFIGDTIRARLAQAGGLGAQTVEIAEFPVGIILLLRPRVNGDGNITMRVHPVVSTITSIDGDNIPQTSTREAETTVMIKDGETVVIGGLIRDEMTRTIQEVPLLSKIPIIGELFRSKSVNKRKSEIMVMITPHIIRDDAPATEKKGG